MTIADLKATADSANEKVHDGLRAAKGVIRKRTNDLADFRDASALRVRRAPLQTVAIAVGVGLVIGFVAGCARGKNRPV
ncbi:MAG: hypothetical protein NUW22_11470 [Acidobacteria bacterium]|nr:hypothetical protein [Acidobacteriota bacterium]